MPLWGGAPAPQPGPCPAWWVSQGTHLIPNKPPRGAAAGQGPRPTTAIGWDLLFQHRLKHVLPRTGLRPQNLYTTAGFDRKRIGSRGNQPRLARCELLGGDLAFAR